LSTQKCFYCNQKDDAKFIITYDNGREGKPPIETLPVCEYHYDCDPAFNDKQFATKVYEI